MLSIPRRSKKFILHSQTSSIKPSPKSQMRQSTRLPFIKHLIILSCFLGTQLGFLSQPLALEVIVGLPYGTHKIGHTAVRVKMPNGEDIIYDFGRYGKVWGPLRMQGEGLMRVWRGDKEAQRYMKKQQSYRSSIGYVIAVSPQEEQSIFEYYESLLEKARWKKPAHLHTRYRLKRDYDGVLTQCTSIALEGIKKIWPKEKWERLLDPKFNIGQGFKPKVSKYYFKTQKRLGRFETVVPLDVIDSFKAELQRQQPLITQVIDYPVKRRKTSKP